ncbi:hypothetical protein [Kitasatospora mediocidica]|uniref:hypothetical protein n=1 Tax=Kitasatospora mediocidica TaxID=58352 RepID=UPI00055EF3B7|nr:hypothetical protein [Kitasatospora mediocidica]
MLRSGRLLTLDEDAVQLAAAGLIRLGVHQRGDTTTGAAAWQTRAGSFAHAWLAFGDTPGGPGLRVPATAVLRSLVHSSAQLLIRAHDGHRPAVLEWLGLRSAQAREQAHHAQVTHPAQPTALALVWHGVQALTTDGEPGHHQRIDERYEAYIREHHHRQDTLALILACARLAATTLTELNRHHPHQTDEHLNEHTARHLPLHTPAPHWVPARPPQPTT